ncbi:MAG: bifunctional methylenetetrahydrofolate dehydrogenase/methenyltetrahydrofolate cyclohydrolase FolD [Lachnospiraceae bacterium]|nr:bifunctional methylenetetrahydrofolate dehydrogenase/methenyltetrahydrofolate cyclohydrolase FolD [Lachnospiraceae bacterium]
MAIIIDGKKVSKEIKDEVREKVLALKEDGVELALAVVIVGNDNASHVYVRNKKRACEYTGIRSIEYDLAEDTKEEELLSLIDKLNEDKDINGILVQMPLPKSIDPDKVINRIDPNKDVDGFHPINKGKMLEGSECFLPCTPSGIIELLKRYNIEIEGKRCVVLGRSDIVGKPMSILLLSENGTVTTCHSRTKDLSSITKEADIIVSAIGKAKFLTSDMVKDGSVVIDVGMNRDENNNLCGDCVYDDLFEKCSAITPVPGGVGPMTIAMLMKNVLHSYENQKGK